MRRWWITYSEQAGRELDALDKSGWHYEIDQAAYEDGRLVIKLDYPHNGSSIPLTAYYPAAYPYFMPTVNAPTLGYERHQNQMNQHLCLLEQNGNDWSPGHDTLVDLLQRMFPELEKANSENAEIRASAKQELIAEPLSAFIPFIRPGVITHPAYAPADAVSGGTFVVKTAVNVISPKYKHWPHIKGSVSAIRNMEGQLLSTSKLTEITGTAHSIMGFWYQLTERPRHTNIEDIKQHILSSMPEELRSRLPMSKGARILIAAVYPDEVALGQVEKEWLFLAAEIITHTQGHYIRANLQPIAGDIDTRESLFARTPELIPLANKRVLIVGLGSLGSPMAMELAKAGVAELDLVDHDVVSVGNTVRWALGWAAFGEFKSHALAHEIIRQYPYTKVTPYHISVGEAYAPESLIIEKTDTEILEEAIQKADLVIDASAEDRVGHYLADICDYYERPFLWLSSTHGGWGGRIARVIPNSGQGCFHCATYHIRENEKLIPPIDPNGNLQARGCASATFTGSGVDANTIALQAVRLAIASLCRGEENGYPDFDWNLAVIRLRDANSGSSLFPEVYTDPLAPHPLCHCNH